MSAEIQKHDAFFSRLIDLVPIELYRPQNDDVDDPIATLQESKYYKVIDFISLLML
jgi:hypothetical protein